MRRTWRTRRIRKTQRIWRIRRIQRICWIRRIQWIQWIRPIWQIWQIRRIQWIHWIRRIAYAIFERFLSFIYSATKSLVGRKELDTSELVNQQSFVLRTSFSNNFSNLVKIPTPVFLYFISVSCISSQILKLLFNLLVDNQVREFSKEFRNGYFCIELSIILSSNHLVCYFL